MSRRIILSPEAQTDITAIERWYQSKEASIGFAFRSELWLIMRYIAHYPYAFPEVKRGIRRALMKEFPYLVYFKLESGNVAVLAVLHQRRRQNI